MEFRVYAGLFPGLGAGYNGAGQKNVIPSLQEFGCMEFQDREVKVQTLLDSSKIWTRIEQPKTRPILGLRMRYDVTGQGGVLGLAGILAACGFREGKISKVFRAL